MNERVKTLLEGRRERIERVLGRDLTVPRGAEDPPLTEERRDYLLEEARDLYWNELEWENLMEEERLEEGAAFTEMAFPGLLAFVRGLLLQETMPDALAPARPRPEVVEDLLRFLAGRVVELRDEMPDIAGEETRRMEVELAMTSRLVDLVLYELHELDEGDVERVEGAGMRT